jgi:CBS domain-containing protein
MKIGEYLKSINQRLVMCGPQDALEHIARAMHTNGIGAMPVCDQGNRMVGIVSERDLVRALATAGWNEIRKMPVSEIMTSKPKSCSPSDDMRTAEQLMRRYHFRHVPIITADGVVGMLSIRDTQALRLQESENEINVLRDIAVAARQR